VPTISNLSPVSPTTFMQTVGIVEIIAGRSWGSIRSLVGGSWRFGCGQFIINLLPVPGHYDIGMRDFGPVARRRCIGATLRSPVIDHVPQGGHVLVVLERHPFHNRTFNEQSGLQDVPWRSAFQWRRRRTRRRLFAGRLIPHRVASADPPLSC
jgi:hypothetical protein